MRSVYDFTVKLNDGESRDLSDYQGKVILIVNTASQCGFTPQYKGLQKLYETYRGQGLEILAFPCNQFQNQEPGDAEEIRQFCDTRYGVTFSLFQKVDVKGKNAHPLFVYLTGEAPGIVGSKAIKWNFTKFLIDRQGQNVLRFAPMTAPEKMEKAVQEML